MIYLSVPYRGWVPNDEEQLEGGEYAVTTDAEALCLKRTDWPTGANLILDRHTLHLKNELRKKKFELAEVERQLKVRNQGSKKDLNVENFSIYKVA